jgi:hypothetical protein
MEAEARREGPSERREKEMMMERRERKSERETLMFDAGEEKNKYRLG